MKIKLFNLLLLIVLPTLLIAQEGRVFDNLVLPSKILKMERKYAVYLPPDYETSNRSYPVLYLLHGSGDDQSGWVQLGEVNKIADKAIKEGKSSAMIIIMPDANTVHRGYFNTITGDFLYEDFFFKELIPFVEKTYRVRTEKKFRFISGLSMGGGGTIVYALHHPEMFAAACPMSAGVGLQDLESSRMMLKKANPTIPDEQIDAYNKLHNGIELVNNLPENQVKKVRWYIDCGDDDSRSESNSKLHMAMNKKGIPHEFRIRDGGHTWSYWKASLPEVLAFISDFK